MSHVPRCAVCWRYAVGIARHEEDMGRTRPRVFDVYVRAYMRAHLAADMGGPGPFKHAPAVPPLVVPEFGRRL